jgi:hypothetical protein
MADKLFPKEIHQKLSELSVLTLNMRKSSLEIAETINYEFVHPIEITYDTTMDLLRKIKALEIECQRLLLKLV